MVLSRRQLLGLGGSATAALLLGSRGLGAKPAPSPRGSATAIPRGDQRIVLISDLNASYGSTSYIPQVHQGVALVRQLKADLVLCAGDMVAGQKLGLAAGHLDAMWQAFERQVLLPIRGAGEPFAPAMGNHDASSSRTAQGYTFALERERAARFWRARQNALGLSLVEASRFPFRYSLRQGDLFAVVIDASSALVPAEDWSWAEAQLASTVARGARLRLLIGHLPPFGLSQGRDRPGEVLHQPDRLLGLMQRQGVHLYVSGHQHVWYPSRVGGVNLLSLGAMGSGPRRLLHGELPPVQTITVLDLFRGRQQLVETTLELNGLRELPVTALPPQLQPSTGPVLQRRDGAMGLG
ncbi:MAG: metallophosphoesterase [Cyanobium sp. M30B3]|nr:MAG: metallophosphoesterase [Cyanobium sp. M30B3]